ncbi:MAG: hypothetical protein DME11_20195 [Candidatus Rokuibacteriota bacterium]|nr:MAG: hypothetical protein DME11_20195 [Candidatus Rokubacteria bacterium]
MTTLSQREWWRRRATLTSAPRRAEPVPADGVSAASAIPFRALMTFTAILLLAPQNYVPILASFRIALVVAAVGIGTHVYDRFRHGQPLTIMTREIRLTGWLLGWTLVTLPFSSWPGGSLAMLLDLYLKALAIFLLIANTVNSVTRLRLIAGGLTLMAVPIGLTGVENFLSGAYLWGGDSQSASRILGYEAPLTQNPNDLALILNLILPLTLALVFIARGATIRAALLLAVGLEASAVIMTFSRAGFLSLATIVGSYLWIIRRRPERAWAYAGLLVAVLCLPLLPGKYFSRLATISDIEADATGSAQQRYQQQVMSVRYVLAHPIVGAGVGMDALAMNQTFGSWQNIHNVYLQYATDLGLPGLLLFLLLLRESIRSARSVQRRSAKIPESRDLFHLATGIQTSLLAFAVSAFFSPVAYHFHFYYFAGLAVAVKAVDAAAARAPRPAEAR